MHVGGQEAGLQLPLFRRPNQVDLQREWGVVVEVSVGQWRVWVECMGGVWVSCARGVCVCARQPCSSFVSLSLSLLGWRACGGCLAPVSAPLLDASTLASE